MNRINMSRTSHVLNILFKSLIIIYPILVVAFWFGWINFPAEYFQISRLPIDIKELANVRFPLRLLSCVVDFIPTAFMLMSYFYLMKLFQLYSRNIIFSAQNIFYLCKIGSNLLLHVVAGILIQPFLSLILTFDAPPGGHMIGIGIGNSEISNLIIAIIVMVIAKIMEEGKKLEEDQAYTV